MTTVPLGQSAYKRDATFAPEIKLENRYVETSPTNLREHATLLSRTGTSDLENFPSSDPATPGGLRGTFAKTGLFGGDLFVVSGANLYRYDGTTRTPIEGVVNGTGALSQAWMKGAGYEYLFLADGLLLQFYNGGSHAKGTLVLAGGPITNQVIQIGGVYYTWGAAVDANAPDGSSAHPWIALLGASDADSLTSMANLLTFNGVRGINFSTHLGGPSLIFTATSTATTLIITSISTLAASNFITTSVFSGNFLSWTGATLTGGNTHVLQGVPVPDGVGIKSLAAVSGYVLASVVNSQKVFFIQPGNTTIAPLDFFSKESNPDNVVDMATVGDQVLISGGGSAENWYATGDAIAPFAPVQGRVYQRGIVEDTATIVLDSVMFIGNDGVAYQVGQTYGGEASYGVNRISTHAIEERIRRQLRRDGGLKP